MAENTRLEIVSPERLVISETVRSVTVPGAEGYFTVMGDHAPLMTTLKPGFVTAIDSEGTAHTIFVRGGFADVSPEGLTILADEARDAAEFSRAEVEQLIAEKQAAVDAAAPDDKAALVNELDLWKNLLLDAAVTAGGTAH
ncbi:MAG TPA: F0F1 ATP synthase subunit epsilon [Alphaproteobacteria bacterium]|nr:F0F1 ATP synthase subunit epsilon [Alphaproteobacteria bacterium]